MSGESLTADARATRDFMAFRVVRAHARITAQATRLLARESGLTPRQWWIIADMMAEQPRTATELAQISDTDKGLLSRNLKSLREMGLVEMARDEADQRQQIISLTEAGRRKHDETLPLMKARNDWLTREVDDDELRCAMRVLEKIEKAAENVTFPTGGEPV